MSTFQLTLNSCLSLILQKLIFLQIHVSLKVFDIFNYIFSEKSLSQTHFYIKKRGFKQNLNFGIFNKSILSIEITCILHDYLRLINYFYQIELELISHF